MISSKGEVTCTRERESKEGTDRLGREGESQQGEQEEEGSSFRSSAELARAAASASAQGDASCPS